MNSKEVTSATTHLVGSHPLMKVMLARRRGVSVEEMETLNKPQARDYVDLLNQPSSEGEGGEDPYFPFAPDRGYIDIYDENNSMWYWHFRARENPDTAPLIIWLQGGPGGASSGDVFWSNGPYMFNNWPTGGKKATLRNITWIQKANVVYPDFPLGVGFSTVTGKKLSRVGKQAQEQILIFFQKFLQKYPEYKKRPLYLTGASYAGHWVPYAASVLKYSKNPDINVQGFYITDDLIDTKIADESYLPFGLKYSQYTKFTEQTVKDLTPILNLCVYSQENGPNRMHARTTLNLCWDTYYGDILRYSYKKNPQFSPYFMPGPKKRPVHWDFSYVKFLNTPGPQKYLGVRKQKFLGLNYTFFEDFAPGDFFVDMKPFVAKLLSDGVKGVITVGDKDFITPYTMSEKVTSEFNWKYQNQFNAVPRTPCKYGLCKEYQNLREIRVFGSGHEISLYKPEFAFEIINTLIGVEED